MPPCKKKKPRLFNIQHKEFVCFFHFIGWENIQVGFHVNLSNPNLELHVPFGFFKVGWDGIEVSGPWKYRTFGKYNKRFADGEIFIEEIEIEK